MCQMKYFLFLSIPNYGHRLIILSDNATSLFIYYEGWGILYSALVVSTPYSLEETYTFTLGKNINIVLTIVS